MTTPNRTPADAETAIRNWLIYREAQPTEDDLWMVLGEMGRLDRQRRDAVTEVDALRAEVEDLRDRVSKLSRAHDGLGKLYVQATDELRLLKRADEDPVACEECAQAVGAEEMPTGDEFIKRYARPSLSTDPLGPTS